MQAREPDEKVSVIMPCFNASRHIAEAIESVLVQTHGNLELIVINDASTDQSASVIESFRERDSRIRLIDLPRNTGGATARNIGIEAAKGRYIAFLDADDVWLPRKLELQIEFIKQSGASFVFSSYERITADGTSFGLFQIQDCKVNYKQLLKRNTIGCLTVVYDAFSLGKIYLPMIKKRQDYALWLRILRSGTEAHGQSLVLAKYRVHDNSLTANKLSAAWYQWLVFRKLEGLSLLKSCYYFAHYTWYNIAKRMAEKLG